MATPATCGQSSGTGGRRALGEGCPPSWGRAVKAPGDPEARASRWDCGHGPGEGTLGETQREHRYLEGGGGREGFAPLLALLLLALSILPLGLSGEGRQWLRAVRPRSAGTQAGLTCSALPVHPVFPVSFALTFASRLDGCFVREPMCPCTLIRRRTTPAPTAAPEPAEGCLRNPPSPSSGRSVNFGVPLYRTALRGVAHPPPSRSGAKLK